MEARGSWRLEALRYQQAGVSRGFRDIRRLMSLMDGMRKHEIVDDG